MGAGCSTGKGALDLLEKDVVVMGEDTMPSHLSFQLPDQDESNAVGSYGASQGDATEHGVTLRFLEKFHQKVSDPCHLCGFIGEGGRVYMICFCCGPGRCARSSIASSSGRCEYVSNRCSTTLGRCRLASCCLPTIELMRTGTVP